MPLYRIGEKLVLFLHIPKTGGTSLDRWLSELGPACLSRQNQPEWLPCPPQHLHAGALAQLVEPGLPDYAFAIVRNPEDRIVSEFFHRHKERTRRIGRHLWRRPLASLEPEALNAYFEAWLDRSFRKAARYPYWDDNHLRPQSAFTSWPGAEVFRFEDGLQPVFDRVSRAIGVAAPPSPPRENVGNRLPLSLSAKARAMIRQHYADDFRQWYPLAAIGGPT